jgi:ribonuclease VapC
MIVLDAWALLAVVNNEPPRPAVERLIREHRARMSWINLGEVHYRTIRTRGCDSADAVVRNARAVLAVELPDADLVLEASRLKARGRISYADCFALATARRHGEPVVTADPEILAFDGDVEVIDPR